jgi:hypothetical protein
LKLPLAKGKYRKPARMLSALLGFSALAVWLFHFHVWYQYDATRPHKPDASSGRSYAQNTHGHIVYLTAEEEAWLTKLSILAFSLACIAGFIGILFDERFTPAPWEKKQW